MLRRLIRHMLDRLRGVTIRPERGDEDAIDDDVLDAWLDEDEIDANGR